MTWFHSLSHSLTNGKPMRSSHMNTLSLIFVLLLVYIAPRVMTLVINSNIESDTVWTVSDSPIYLYCCILLMPNVTVNVENGVEIIFPENYGIYVLGTLNVGCYDYDTRLMNDTAPGLYNSSSYVYIHGTSDTQGGFDFDPRLSIDHTSMFCNTKFDNLLRVAYSYGNNELLLDHCEISNTFQRFDAQQGLFDSEYGNKSHLVVQNSYIHDFSKLDNAMFDCDLNVEINNCLIEDFTGPLFRSGNHIKFVNNKVNGTNSINNCIELNGNNNNNASYATYIIEHNEMINCNTAIYVTSNTNSSIKFNDISDANTGIEINYVNNTNISLDITYNNFVNNLLNIRLYGTGSGNVVNGGYNYWGHNSSDPRFIATFIMDMCDGLGSGLFTFWPWLRDIYTGNNGNNISIFTFNFSDCSDVTSSPTALPTSSPTMPTEAPSRSPTTGFPTRDPTGFPSVPPTPSPSDPSEPPTVDPTHAPTELPTIYPSSTTSTTSTVRIDNALTEEPQKDDTNNSGTVIVVVIACIIVLFMTVPWYFHYKRIKKEQQIKMGIHANPIDQFHIEFTEKKTDNNIGTTKGMDIEYKNVQPSAPKPDEYHEESDAPPVYQDIAPSAPNADEYDSDAPPAYQNITSSAPIADIQGNNNTQAAYQDVDKNGNTNTQPGQASNDNLNTTVDGENENEGIANNQQDGIKEWLKNGTDLKDDDINIYYEKLIENGFDNLNLIKMITNDDLKEINIQKLGHRKAILLAAHKLRGHNDNGSASDVSGFMD